MAEESPSTMRSPLITRLRSIPEDRRKDFLRQLKNVVDDEAPGPLSSRQEQLWLLNQLGTLAGYGLAFHYRLRGPLDVPALAAAVGEVFARHAVLRSRQSQCVRLPCAPNRMPDRRPNSLSE